MKWKEITPEWFPWIIKKRLPLVLLFTAGMGAAGAFAEPYCLGEKGRRLAAWIYCRRFLISICIFAFLVILHVSGSSMGYWSMILGEGKSGLLAGVSRGVRSDEWGTLTPLCFGQEYNQLGAYSRYTMSQNGVLADGLIVYGQPAWEFLTLFRPFYWGYLLFGSEAGLSWFWCGRMLALILSFFEFGMLLSGGNKKLSVMLSVCVAFAPFLQWWFAINGLAEMLIYGACFVLGENYLVTARYGWKKYAVGIAMAICAGGYVLTFYPAWMAPIAWSFVPAALWVFIKQRKKELLCKKDIIPWIIMLLLFAGAIAYLLYTSQDTIQAVMNSSYPGSGNQSTGGKGLLWMLKYPLSLFSWMYNDSLIVENSSVICFAPVGFFISVWVMRKEKKKDLLLILLLATDAFFIWYYCVGSPRWLAKIMLLFYTNGNRGPQVIGFLRLFILIRALSLREKGMGRCTSIILALVSSVFAVGMAWCFTHYAHPSFRCGYLDQVWQKAGAFAVFAAVFYLLYRMERNNGTAALLAVCCVIAISSLWINPIQIGAKEVTESATINAIRKISKENPGSCWIALDINYPGTNIPAMAGANCVNTTQTYPLLDKWKLLDETGQNEETYNRYCHIKMQPGKATEFELLKPDVICVTVTEDDLEKMQVTHILSPYPDLPKRLTDWNIQLEELFRGANYSIYEIEK